jgi:hypothetical protein
MRFYGGKCKKGNHRYKELPEFDIFMTTAPARENSRCCGE